LLTEYSACLKAIAAPKLGFECHFGKVFSKLGISSRHELTRRIGRWSQRVIDLADGDPSKGNFIFRVSLAAAFATRAAARCCLGCPGWPDDQRHGLAMAHSADPMSYAKVITYVYSPGISNGVLAADDRAVREIEDALRIAERSGDDFAVAVARLTLGLALVHRHTAAERDRGQKLLAEVSEAFLRRGHGLGELPIVRRSGQSVVFHHRHR
jgi:hypothetical protein